MPAHPPTVCLSIPSSSSQIRSVKSRLVVVTIKYIALSPSSSCRSVGWSLGRSSPGTPADLRSSAEWRVDEPRRRPSLVSPIPMPQGLLEAMRRLLQPWNLLGRFTFSDLQGCQMAQLDSSCPLSQPADDDLDKSTQGKATARRSVAQFCQPPCVHLFCLSGSSADHACKA